MIASENHSRTLVTDHYQLTMAYAYWRAGKHEEPAVFDYFFRKCPFGGEFAVFAGLADLLEFMSGFRFQDGQIAYLKGGPLAGCQPAFFEWLRTVSFAPLQVYSFREGSAVFPRVPIVRVEGPLAIGQLLETPLLNALNFPSLMTTNAVRYRLAAGPGKTLLEFGLRRAQDGMRASHYAWLGGFDGTSNVEAARLLGSDPKGTMAHSLIESFSGLGDLETRMLVDRQGRVRDFVTAVLEYRSMLGFDHTHEGELAAFISYAQSFPERFLALVDTYDTLKSGVPNYIVVALALMDFGYQPVGIRNDSGDLAFLSKEERRMFREVDAWLGRQTRLDESKIFSSNDIDEEVLWALRQEGHENDGFGIGTHLATCSRQPAFGGVYKLVELNGLAKIKLSNDPAKVTIPGRKEPYRLIGKDGKAILDLIVEVGAAGPRAGKRVLCRHPFDETKRAVVIPKEVIGCHRLVWTGAPVKLPSRGEVRDLVQAEIGALREDHLRPVNSTPYKVSVSGELYENMHRLWLEEAPLTEIS